MFKEILNSMLDGMLGGIAKSTIKIFILSFITYFTCKFIEKRYYNSIKKREESMKDIFIFNEKYAPEKLVSGKFHLIRGSAVMSGGYFKRYAAGLKSNFGGRLNSLESFMDIGRRESILRMKEQAKEMEVDTIFNVRFETTMIRQHKGWFCAEFLAYGTAWKRKR
ncbi:MAG: YbjQ family protein [Campylobacteraceae bacterium]|jgi:uncharacterized protein YbjQ (UPF0145 family)|nr:YbjQ family protein [Campylobacteraceae bacterium]